MTDTGERIGLALSGGGYRAAAFHLGTLRALNKMGLLDKVDVISSVSGGSIIAVYYALHKDDSFEEFENGIRRGLNHCALWLAIINLIIVILIPVALCLGFHSGWWSLLYLLLIPFWFEVIPSSKWIAMAYDCIFFKDKKLKDLPDSPVVGINSTNITTSRIFTFSKQDLGGYDYKDHDNWKSYIKGDDIKVSFAVASSTCVPLFFSPTKIDKLFFDNGKYKETLLVDGGLYDNQGTYILGSSNPLYNTKNVIVSDAGNSKPSSKHVFNPLCLMSQSLETLMNRIRKIQIIDNIYRKRYDVNDEYKYDSETNLAYISLRWSKKEDLVNRFLNNIKDNHVPRVALEGHGVTNAEVKNYVENDDKDAKERIVEKFTTSIKWKELLEQSPSKETYDLAYGVWTNLIPLSKKEIDALSGYAEWLTTLQVRTYLPHLLNS